MKKNLNSKESIYSIYGINNDFLYSYENNLSIFSYNDAGFFKEYNLNNNNTSWTQGKVSNNFLYFSIHRSQINSINGNKNLIQTWFAEVQGKKQLSFFEFEDFQMAIECFTRLDPEIKYSRVVIIDEIQREKEYKKNKKLKAEILVETYDGEIPLNQLSAGYQSCLSIFLEIIMKAKTIAGFEKSIYEYDGLILIDEIDLHLHPEWQKKFLEILRWMIPDAQIIATTHSPHIIQSAEANEVIVIENRHGLCYTKASNSNSIYGYQGWSIEEILEDVMGLNNTYSELYNELLNSIEEAIDRMDYKTAKTKLEEFKKLLHPNNHLAKILSIQIAPLKGVIKYD